MTAEQAYVKFLVKIDNNFENSKVSGDRGRFVLIFNESQNKMIELILDRKKDDESRYIQKVLVEDKKLNKKRTSNNLDIFEIPKDYFDFSSAYSKATREDCERKVIELYEIKNDNKTIILTDEFTKPSFLAREAPITISSDEIKLYKDDFIHEELYLSYHRYPVQISLQDENNPESGFNTDFNPEFDDKFLDRVISMASGEFSINDSDPKYQMDKQRAIQKI